MRFVFTATVARVLVRFSGSFNRLVIRVVFKLLKNPKTAEQSNGKKNTLIYIYIYYQTPL